MSILRPYDMPLPASQIMPERQMLSDCCGREEHDDVEGFCGACCEGTGFSCSVCDKREGECECEED